MWKKVPARDDTEWHPVCTDLFADMAAILISIISNSYYGFSGVN